LKRKCYDVCLKKNRNKESKCYLVETKNKNKGSSPRNPRLSKKEEKGNEENNLKFT
jgi:hypothetical protein